MKSTENDFIITGNTKEIISQKINELRTFVTTTEPIWNAEHILGLEINRDRNKNIILITMTSKIIEVSTKFQVNMSKKRQIPMPTSGYIVKDHEFENLPENSKQFLDKQGIKKYMSIVGNLIWISGIRLDILFVVMYLSSYHGLCKHQDNTI